jgi:hypothetical protein
MSPVWGSLGWRRGCTQYLNMSRTLITALLLAGSLSAQTFDAPSTTQGLQVAAKRPQQPFSGKIFWAEAGAFTLSNILDGYTTVSQTPGYEESPFPEGSLFLLGKHPSVGRYVAIMGAIQVATSFAAYRLEHSQKRWLRIFGHALMMQGTYSHTDGFISNVRLRMSVSNLPQAKLTPGGTLPANPRF